MRCRTGNRTNFWLRRETWRIVKGVEGTVPTITHIAGIVILS